MWRKPAHQTKQKRTEHLPLSEQGAALVASILEGADPASPCLFPGYVPGRPPRDIEKVWAAVTSITSVGQ